MVDASRFVSGTSVDVRALVGTLLGGVLVTAWAGWASLIDDVMGYLSRLVTEPVAAVSWLLELLVSLPANVIVASWRSAAQFMVVIGQAAGPFAFPAAMLVVMVSLLLGDWALRQMGVV